MTHEGAQYVVINPSIKPDISSSTDLQIHGSASRKGLSWVDGFEELHFVKVSPDEPEVTVIFPVRNAVVLFRAANDGAGCYMTRAGCSFDQKWCEATFSYKKAAMWHAEHVLAKLQFYTEEKAKRVDQAG